MRANIILRGLLLVIALGLAWFIRGQLIESSHRRIEEEQWVKLIDEPPPPPPRQEPPPEPEPEPIPEPETSQIKEEIEKTEESKEASDDALGADEEGQAGSDSFGIRAKKGGKDLLETGSSGQKGLLYLAYGGTVVEAIERKLAADPKLRGKSYVALIKVWINPQGRIERIELGQSTGDPEVDRRLVQELSTFSGSFPPPPAGMGQPLKIRLSSRIPVG